MNGKWVILIVDNHESRFNAAMWDYCAERHILLLALPPNSTPLLQPVDVGPNERFKYWLKRLHDKENRALPVGAGYSFDIMLLDVPEDERDAARHVLLQKWDGPVGKHNIIQRILHPAWKLAFTQSRILRGWRDTGLVPLNRRAVKPTAFVPKTVEQARAMLPEATKTFHVPADLEELLPLPTNAELAGYQEKLAKKKGKKGRPKQKGPRMLTPLGEQKAQELYIEKLRDKEEKQSEKEVKKIAKAEAKAAKAKEQEEKKQQREREREEKKKQKAADRERKQNDRAEKKKAKEKEKEQKQRTKGKSSRKRDKHKEKDKDKMDTDDETDEKHGAEGVERGSMHIKQRRKAKEKKVDADAAADSNASDRFEHHCSTLSKPFCCLLSGCLLQQQVRTSLQGRSGWRRQRGC